MHSLLRLTLLATLLTTVACGRSVLPIEGDAGPREDVSPLVDVPLPDVPTAFCGNGVCEASEFETCTNCPGDCGNCPGVTCIEVATCIFGCFDFDGSIPPEFSFSCITTCSAQACADVQFFVDQVIDCAVNQLFTCGDFSCVMDNCRSEIAACLGAPRCPAGM